MYYEKHAHTDKYYFHSLKKQILHCYFHKCIIQKIYTNLKKEFIIYFSTAIQTSFLILLPILFTVFFSHR